jgi:hypothetical protein
LERMLENATGQSIRDSSCEIGGSEAEVLRVWGNEIPVPVGLLFTHGLRPVMHFCRCLPARWIGDVTVTIGDVTVTIGDVTVTTKQNHTRMRYR